MLLKRKQQFSFSATLTAIPIPGRVVFSSHLSFLRLTSRNCEDKIKERPVDGSRIISLRSFDAKRASRVTRFCRHEDWWKTCEIFKGTKNRRTAPSKRSRAWKRSIFRRCFKVPAGEGGSFSNGYALSSKKTVDTTLLLSQENRSPRPGRNHLDEDLEEEYFRRTYVSNILLRRESFYFSWIYSRKRTMI